MLGFSTNCFEWMVEEKVFQLCEAFGFGGPVVVSSTSSSSSRCSYEC